MAVTGDGNRFTISNGDFEALQRIREAYHLRDESAVIIFAIGLLSQANGRPVSIQKDDGTVVRLLPSDNIRNNNA